MWTTPQPRSPTPTRTHESIAESPLCRLLAQADLARQAEEKLEAKLKAMSKYVRLCACVLFLVCKYDLCLWTDGLPSLHCPSLIDQMHRLDRSGRWSWRRRQRSSRSGRPRRRPRQRRRWRPRYESVSAAVGGMVGGVGVHGNAWVDPDDITTHKKKQNNRCP